MHVSLISFLLGKILKRCNAQVIVQINKIVVSSISLGQEQRGA